MSASCGLRNAFLCLGIGALAGLALIASSGAALAVRGEVPTAVCDAAKCETCLECEGQPCRCLKCGIDPQCLGDPGDPGLTSDFTSMVKDHNGYRGQHCAGPLTWSPQLATAAQKWANACTPNGKGGFEHDSNRGQAGENLFWGTRTAGIDAVKWWYDEIKDYNFKAPVWSSAVGHFTQVVWKDSKQIGCGVASCGGVNLWVCRYSPPGNWNVNNPGVMQLQVGCAQPAAAAKLPQAGSPGGQGGGKAKMATADNDVDIYNSPVEPREVIGMMGDRTKARVLEYHQDGWCKLQKPAPGIEAGWVAQDHLSGCR